MALYIILIFIFLVFLLIATNKRTQSLGCLLSASQTGRGSLRVCALNTDDRHYKKTNNILALVAIFVMWFLTAFRAWNIGNDTNNYVTYFENIITTGMSSQYRIEYGFQLLCLLVGLFTSDPQVFLIICTTICYVGVGFYAFKYSKNIIVSSVLIFTFCFSIFTNTLRQDIAMVICLYAYRFIKDKRNFKAVLLIIFAMTFHVSAGVCLLLFANRFIKSNFILNVLIALIFALLGVSGVLNMILSGLGLYDNYLHGQYAGTGWIAVTYSILQSLFLYGFIYSAYRNKTSKNKVVLVNCVLHLFVNSLGFAVNLFTRAAQYFLLPLIVEFPNACYDGKIKFKKYWLLLFCSILLIYFIVSLIFRSEWNNLYPYHFFWD